MKNLTNENITIENEFNDNDNNNPSIYICPAKFQNLEKTIINKHNNEYIWALNARCEKMYNNLQNGDICLFGGKDGYKYYGKIKDKRLMNNDEINLWPYPSPSRTTWRYIFSFEKIEKCDLTIETARQLRGWGNKQHWQRQSKLKIGNGYENFYNYLINNNYI